MYSVSLKFRLHLEDMTKCILFLFCHLDKKTKILGERKHLPGTVRHRRGAGGSHTIPRGGWK